MKSTLTIVACSLLLLAANASAATPKNGKETAAAAPVTTAQADSAAPRPAQQSKMKTCNVEAKGKKGDERKAFMKACLSK